MKTNHIIVIKMETYFNNKTN